MTAQPNIVLVGFMGTGKTTVGKRLAEKLGLRFLDMDDAIVQREEKPITRIFEEDGESHFRAVERDLVRELSRGNGLVIGTGGGIVLNGDNVSDFEASGLVVCLSASPETILARVEHDTGRPLLEGDDKLARIHSILATRKPLYDAIGHQIDTSDLSLDEVAERIEALYRRNGTLPMS